MKHLYLFAFLVLSAINALKAQNAINIESILFDYDKSELTTDAEFQLREILKIENIDSILLTGHTDSDGSDNYNLVLSKKRVFSVQNYLVKHGFSNDRITVNYHGEHIPLTDNNSEDGKQQNRRVEIKIFFQPKPVITAIKVKEEPKIVETPKVDTIETVVKIVEDTTINIGGLKVTLTKDDFYAYNGMPVFEPILTVEDATRNGLNTMTTNGSLLVSDGMIKMNPLPTGSCFTKPIKVYFPVKTSNTVSGKRKHYILTKKGWKVGGKKRGIDIVEMDDVSYYEMTVACTADGLGNYHNCDVKVTDSKHKLKLPVGYKMKSISLQYPQLLGIYTFGNYYDKGTAYYNNKYLKRKNDFVLPCQVNANTATAIVQVYHKKTNTIITKSVPFEKIKHSVSRSRCLACPKGWRMRINHRKTRPYKKFKVKRKTLKA